MSSTSQPAGYTGEKARTLTSGKNRDEFSLHAPPEGLRSCSHSIEIDSVSELQEQQQPPSPQYPYRAAPSVLVDAPCMSKSGGATGEAHKAPPLVVEQLLGGTSVATFGFGARGSSSSSVKGAGLSGSGGGILLSTSISTGSQLQRRHRENADSGDMSNSSYNNSSSDGGVVSFQSNCVGEPPSATLVPASPAAIHPRRANLSGSAILFGADGVELHVGPLSCTADVAADASHIRNSERAARLTATAYTELTPLAVPTAGPLKKGRSAADAGIQSPATSSTKKKRKSKMTAAAAAADGRAEDDVSLPVGSAPAQLPSFSTQLCAVLIRTGQQFWCTKLSIIAELIVPALFIILVIILNAAFGKEVINEDNYAEAGEWSPRTNNLDYTEYLCYWGNGPAVPSLYDCFSIDMSHQRYRCGGDNSIIPFPNICYSAEFRSIEAVLAYYVAAFTGDIVAIPTLDGLILHQWIAKKAHLVEQGNSASAMAALSSLGITASTPTRLDALCRSGLLYFAPAENVPDGLIEYFMEHSKLFAYTYGGTFATVKEAEAAMEEQGGADPLAYNSTWGLVVVSDIRDGFDVEIRLNINAIPVLKPTVDVQYPGGYAFNGGDIYLASGYITIQRMLYDYFLFRKAQAISFLASRGNATASLLQIPGVGVKDPAQALYPLVSSFPSVDGSRTYLLELAAPLVAFVVVLAFLYPFSQITKRLVLEKEIRIREAMLIMGLRRSTLWTSYFITAALEYIVISGFITLLLCAAVARKSSGGLIFLMTLLYGITLVPLSGLLSTLFTKAHLAALLAPLLYFVLSMLIFAMNNAKADMILGLSVFSPTAYAALMRHVFNAESASGFEVHDLRNNPLYNTPSPYKLLIMLVGDFFIYTLLMLYLDAVLPQEWGSTKHPFFFIVNPIKVLGRLYQRKKNGEEEEEQKDKTTNDGGRGSNATLEGFDPFLGLDPQGKAKHVSVRVRGLTKVFGRPSLLRRLLRKISGRDSKENRGDGPLVAVDNFSCDLYSGEISVLLGPNGAGKSTIVNMMTGMLSADSGDCMIEGRSILHHTANARHLIGYCPQHNILWPQLTCRAHVEFFGRIKGLHGEVLEHSIVVILRSVDLLEKADSPARTLSGGQKRKLSIAIAFVGLSKVVLLDEPTAGLDAAARRHVWSLLRAMSQHRTILLTTHFIDEADLLGDSVAIVSHSRLLCAGSSLFLRNYAQCGYTVHFDLLPMLLGPLATMTTTTTTAVANPTMSSDRTVTPQRTIASGGARGASMTEVKPRARKQQEQMQSEVQLRRRRQSMLAEVWKKLDTLVREHVPAASLVLRTDCEVEYRIPVAEEAILPALLRSMESAGAALPIRGYAIRAPTLEDAFIAIVDHETREKKDINNKSKSINTTTIASVATEGLEGVDPLEDAIHTGAAMSTRSPQSHVGAAAPHISRGSAKFLETEAREASMFGGGHGEVGAVAFYSELSVSTASTPSTSAHLAWVQACADKDTIRRGTIGTDTTISDDTNRTRRPALNTNLHSDTMSLKKTIMDGEGIVSGKPFLTSPSSLPEAPDCFSSPTDNAVVITGTATTATPQAASSAEFSSIATGDIQVDAVWSAQPVTSCCTLYLAQLKAMLYKRFYYSLRDRRMQFFQIICPVLCFLLAMLLQLVDGAYTDPLYFTPSLFREKSVMYGSQCESFWGTPIGSGDDRLPTNELGHGLGELEVIMTDQYSSTTTLSTFLQETWYTHGDYPRYAAAQCVDMPLTSMLSSFYPRAIGARLATVTLYNTSSKHSLPFALHTSYMIWYLHMLEEVYGEDATDMVENAVFRMGVAPLTQKQDKYARTSKSTLSPIMIGIIILIPFTFMPANPVVWVTKEREIGARHIQRISGLRYLIYWISNLLFDMAAYIITLILVFALFAIFKRWEYVGTEAIGASIVAFLLYGLCCCLGSYAVSFMFSEHSTAQVVVMGVSFLTGFVCVLLVFVLSMLDWTYKAADTMRWIFRVLPPYSIGEVILNLALLEQNKLKDPSLTPWSLSTTLYADMYMLIEIPIFAAVTLLWDHPARRAVWVRMCSVCSSKQHDHGEMRDVRKDGVRNIAMMDATAVAQLEENKSNTSAIESTKEDGTGAKAKTRNSTAGSKNNKSNGGTCGACAMETAVVEIIERRQSSFQARRRNSSCCDSATLNNNQVSTSMFCDASQETLFDGDDSMCRDAAAISSSEAAAAGRGFFLSVPATPGVRRRKSSALQPELSVEYLAAAAGAENQLETQTPFSSAHKCRGRSSSAHSGSGNNASNSNCSHVSILVNPAIITTPQCIVPAGAEHCPFDSKPSYLYPPHEPTPGDIKAAEEEDSDVEEERLAVYVDEQHAIAVAARRALVGCMKGSNDAKKHERNKKDVRRSGGSGAAAYDSSDDDNGEEKALQDVIRVVDLRKVYHSGHKVAVRSLTFGVMPGEVFGFLGTNGAGKTTALSILTQEQTATCGRAYVCGHDVMDESTKALQFIGYCPQFDACFDLLTVEEQLTMYGGVRGIIGEDAKKMVSSLIQLCGLEQYKDVLASKLSGGNRRRLSVAIALVGAPRVVCLDEPSAGMDPIARRQLWRALTRVSARCSVMLTTHHLEEVEELADCVGIMVDGSLRCLGDLPHLKHKYARDAYQLTIRVHPKVSRERKTEEEEEEEKKKGRNKMGARNAAAEVEDPLFVPYGCPQRRSGSVSYNDVDVINTNDNLIAFMREKFPSAILLETFNNEQFIFSVPVAAVSGGAEAWVWAGDPDATAMTNPLEEEMATRGLSSAPSPSPVFQSTSGGGSQLFSLSPVFPLTNSPFVESSLARQQNRVAQQEQQPRPVRLSDIFGALQQHKEALSITDYSVTQVSMEQVFLSVCGVEDQKNEEEEVEKRKRSGFMSRFLHAAAHGTKPAKPKESEIAAEEAQNREGVAQKRSNCAGATATGQDKMNGNWKQQKEKDEGKINAEGNKPKRQHVFAQYRRSKWRTAQTSPLIEESWGDKEASSCPAATRSGGGATGAR